MQQPFVSPLEHVTLRMHIGFPKDAGLFARALLILALGPMALLRTKLGVRVVSIPKMLISLIGMFLFGLLALAPVLMSSSSVEDDIEPALILWAGSNALILLHRLKRWLKRLQTGLHGEDLVANAVGISHFSTLVPYGSAERYLDPLLVVGCGIALLFAPLLYVYKAIGAWLVLSGCALLGIEKYVDDVRLDQHDGMLEGKALQQLAERQHQGVASANRTPVQPLSTGLDNALARTVIERKAREDATRSMQSVNPEPRGSSSIGDGACSSSRRLEMSARPSPAQGELDSQSPAQSSSLARIAAHHEATTVPRHEASAWLPVVVIGSLACCAGIRALRYANEDSSPMAGKVAVAGPARGAVDVTGSVPKVVSQVAKDVANEGGTALAPSRVAANHMADIDAELKLGLASEFGTDGQPHDLSAAAAHYRRAAELGDSRGERLFAEMLFAGEGIPQDDSGALTWYLRAAAQGDALAQWAAGVMYESGRGAAKDDVQAVRLYRAAAIQGLADAQRCLGDMYRVGKGGLTVDNDEALIWYRRAADQGDAEAKKVLNERQ